MNDLNNNLTTILFLLVGLYFACKILGWILAGIYIFCDAMLEALREKQRKERVRKSEALCKPIIQPVQYQYPIAEVVSEGIKAGKIPWVCSDAAQQVIDRELLNFGIRTKETKEETQARRDNQWLS